MFEAKTVKVAVENTAYHFDKLYSYTIPAALLPVSVGCRVMVPFGGGNRRCQAVVMEYDVPTDFKKLKPVISVLDKEPPLNEEQLKLAEFVKKRTFCTLFEAMQAMLPPGLYQKILIAYEAVQPSPPEDELNIEERIMLKTVRAHQSGITRDKLLSEMGFEKDSDMPDRLIKKGFLRRCDAAVQMRGDASVRMCRLHPNLDNENEIKLSARECTEKQRRVIDFLQEQTAASVKEICYFCGVTEAVVKLLIRKNLIILYENEILRSRTAALGEPQTGSAALNEEQQTAYRGLLALADSGKPQAALLYGVTGSGKTQVYMHLIDHVLEQGKQVLVLVPEISLTPQTMTLFAARYGDRIAVLHSGLSIGERLDEWKRVQRGDADIVIGTRSAVFAPLKNIGLIVMDEEQEHTYKSENAPRFHARDVAKWRCQYHGATLLMCSATPSVESYHHAVCGRYHLFTLGSRYGDARLPAVKIVDMREDDPEAGAIGSELKKQITLCLEQEKQVILLLNRRGYNTFVSCRTCGHVITCPACSISMTYHRANEQLMCHYCGHTEPFMTKCPACGSDKVRYDGLGTQRVEEELNALFPDASVLRMDADTTMSKDAYEKKFEAFSNGDFQIMIGTQMVAKGLDFPRVALVGVLNADSALFSEDYRSFETAFSLFTQVIGRAGRRDGEGMALIQTYTPDHYVIDLAAKQDYVGFYQIEIAARQAMHYPPYADFVQLGFVSASEQACLTAAKRTLSVLKELIKTNPVSLVVHDAVPARLPRLNFKYRYKILVKTVVGNAERQLLSDLLMTYSKLPESKKTTLFVDINPASAM